MDNKYCFVIGITSNWDFAAYTVLLSLMDHKPSFDFDVVIIHNGLSKKQMNYLTSLYHCNFQRFDESRIKSKKFSRVSKMAFARYECFNLLDKYDTVIWLDADLLIIKDISEMCQNIKSSHVALYPHPDTPILVSFSSEVPGYDHSAQCYNTGVFVLFKKGNWHKGLCDWCIDKTNEWAKHINSDQAIINLAFQEFNLTIQDLPLKFNCPPEQKNSNSCILHPWGKAKFWTWIENTSWDRYYQKWLQLSGENNIIKWYTRGITGSLIRLIKSYRKNKRMRQLKNQP